MTMATNMSRMVKFVDAFPVAEIVSTLLTKYLRHMEQHLHQALIEARERLARRGVLLEGGEDE